MDDRKVTEFTKSKGLVPKLSMIHPSELVAILMHHFRTCTIDHASLERQAHQVSSIDFEVEVFECYLCKQTEHFEIPARTAISVDEYICRLLSQGVRFNSAHFASCVKAKGEAQ